MELIILLLLVFWLGIALFLPQEKWTTFAVIPVIVIMLWSVRWYIVPWLIFLLVTYLLWFLVNSITKFMHDESNVVLSEDKHNQCKTVQTVHDNTEEQKLEQRIISIQKDLHMTTTRNQNLVRDTQRKLDEAKTQITRLDMEKKEALGNEIQAVLKMLDAKDIAMDREAEIVELMNEIKHLKEMHEKVKAAEHEEQACIQASAAKASESEKQAWIQAYAAKANTMHREIEIYELKNGIKSMSAMHKNLLERNKYLVETKDDAIAQVATTTIDQLPDTLKKQFETILQNKLDQQAQRMEADKKKAVDGAKICDINKLPKELKIELDKIHQEIVSKREARITEQFEKKHNPATDARIVELEQKLSSKSAELEATKKASTARGDERVTELEKVVESKNAELEEEKKKKEDLQRQVNDMAKKAEYADEQLKIRDELINTTTESTSTQQADIAGKSARILELENQLEQDRNTLNEMINQSREVQREQILVKDTQLNELNQLYSGATTRIQELEEHLKSAQETSMNLQLQLNISNSNLGSLVEQFDSTNKSLSEMREQARRQTEILNAIECRVTDNEEPTGSIDHLQMVEKACEDRDSYMDIALWRQATIDSAIIDAGYAKEDFDEISTSLDEKKEEYNKLQGTHRALEKNFKELHKKHIALLKKDRPIANAKSVASKLNQSNTDGDGSNGEGSSGKGASMSMDE